MTTKQKEMHCWFAAMHRWFSLPPGNAYRLKRLRKMSARRRTRFERDEKRLRRSNQASEAKGGNPEYVVFYL